MRERESTPRKVASAQVECGTVGVSSQHRTRKNMSLLLRIFVKSGIHGPRNTIPDVEQSCFNRCDDTGLVPRSALS